jgi:hypothetical protein
VLPYSYRYEVPHTSTPAFADALRGRNRCVGAAVSYTRPIDFLSGGTSITDRGPMVLVMIEQTRSASARSEAPGA